ncbi:ribonuclease H-like domain-containing protein [Tanacetum coccineum]
MEVLPHEHPLKLIDLNPKYPRDEVVYDDEEELIMKQDFRCPCGRCGQEINFYHSCEPCKFIIHSKCALLWPDTISHKYDKHVMTLRYFPVEDHSGDYFCEVCEEEFNPNGVFYHCDQCVQSMHPACCVSILHKETTPFYLNRGVAQFDNIKFGEIFMVNGHPHDVSFCRGVESDGECAKCGEHLQDKLILKCLQCKFAIDRDCARWFSINTNSLLFVPVPGQFTRDNKCSVEFDEFGFSVKDFLTRHILLKCDSSGDLYPVTKPSPIPSALLSINPTTWHKRLGHLGAEVLRSLISRNYISCNKETSSHICHTCQLGKHVKLPFVSSDTRVSSSFDIIDSDIWSSPIVSVSGFKYYVLFLDHFSHYLWIYPLRHKSDVFQKFLHVRFYVKNQFKCEIKAFQRDHGANPRFSFHMSHISPLPKSPSIALSDPNWRAAMYDEYNALVKNNGSLSTYKARLVANGRTQQVGIDCDDTFSPVVKPATIQTELSLALSRHWPVHQLDVKKDFLNGDLSKTDYMYQPPGFVDSRFLHHVCKLQRSLYGLKQAPRAWFQRFASYALRVGFSSSRYLLRRIISSLHKEFDMTDLGALNYFLRISVTRDSIGMFLSQKKYALELLKRAHIANCNPTRTLVDTESKLGSDGDLLQRLFDNYIMQEDPYIDEETLDRARDEKFAQWFKDHIQSNGGSEHLKVLARGPMRYVESHKGYFVNGYKFHTLKHGDGRVTHNSGVCVKGSTYNEFESDYYGLLVEVLEVNYHDSNGRCVVVLFKCDWFEPIQGVRVNRKHNLVDIKYKSKGCQNDPFILASQAEQVYYAPYPSMTKDLKDWWAVVKATPRSIYEVTQSSSEVVDDYVDVEEFFQENEMPTCSNTTTNANENTEIEELGDLEVGDAYMEVSENEEEFVDTYENLEVNEAEEEFIDRFDDSDDENELALSDHSSDEDEVNLSDHSSDEDEVKL